MYWDDWQYIRWWNLHFKPAIVKLHDDRKISKYVFEKLYEMGSKYDRKRIPNGPRKNAATK